MRKSDFPGLERIGVPHLKRLFLTIDLAMDRPGVASTHDSRLGMGRRREENREDERIQTAIDVVPPAGVWRKIGGYLGDHPEDQLPRIIIGKKSEE